MALPALNDCKPGFYPVEYNILIAPELAEERTKGGLILPDAIKETNQMASMRGLLVDISPLAFNYDEYPEGFRKPQPGDRVVFAKYAGTVIEGADGREYRAAKDKDLIAVYSGETDG